MKTLWEKIYKQHLKSEIKRLSALQTESKREGYQSSYHSYRISQITLYLNELNRLNGKEPSHLYKNKNRKEIEIFKTTIELGNGYCLKLNKGFKKETYALYMNDYGFQISKTKAISEKEIIYEDNRHQSWHWIIDLNDDLSILEKQKEELEGETLKELKEDYKIKRKKWEESYSELNSLYQQKEQEYQKLLKEFEDKWKEKIKPYKDKNEELRKESSSAFRMQFNEAERIFKTLKGEI